MNRELQGSESMGYAAALPGQHGLLFIISTGLRSPGSSLHGTLVSTFSCCSMSEIFKSQETSDELINQAERCCCLEQFKLQDTAFFFL